MDSSRAYIRKFNLNSKLQSHFQIILKYLNIWVLARIEHAILLKICIFFINNKNLICNHNFVLALNSGLKMLPLPLKDHHGGLQHRSGGTLKKLSSLPCVDPCLAFNSFLAPFLILSSWTILTVWRIPTILNRIRFSKFRLWIRILL